VGARRDNLQPSGYERATLPEKVSDYRRFRARSLMNVRVWLRRFFGHSLVGHDHNVLHEGKWWIVYCFAGAEHAKKFQMRFGGERFDPKDMSGGRSCLFLTPHVS
jgi:hypothetical protein